MAAGLCTSTAHLELMCPLHLAGRLTAAPSPTPHFISVRTRPPPPHPPTPLPSLTSSAYPSVLHSSHPMPPLCAPVRARRRSRCGLASMCAIKPNARKHTACAAEHAFSVFRAAPHLMERTFGNNSNDLHSRRRGIT